MRKQCIEFDIPDSCDVEHVRQMSRVGGPEHNTDYIDVRVHLKPREPLAVQLAKAVLVLVQGMITPNANGNAFRLANQIIDEHKQEASP